MRIGQDGSIVVNLRIARSRQRQHASLRQVPDFAARTKSIQKQYLIYFRSVVFPILPVAIISIKKNDDLGRHGRISGKCCRSQLYFYEELFFGIVRIANVCGVDLRVRKEQVINGSHPDQYAKWDCEQDHDRVDGYTFFVVLVHFGSSNSLSIGIASAHKPLWELRHDKFQPALIMPILMLAAHCSNGIEFVMRSKPFDANQIACLKVMDNIIQCIPKMQAEICFYFIEFTKGMLPNIGKYAVCIPCHVVSSHLHLPFSFRANGFS
jgi:hypothetical protein